VIYNSSVGTNTQTESRSRRYNKFPNKISKVHFELTTSCTFSDIVTSPQAGFIPRSLFCSPLI
jgi:hypothetical protein